MDAVTVMENYKVSDQVIVLDNFQLVVTSIFNDSIGQEITPLGELVETFSLFWAV